jgi:hypothetical protein
MDRTADFRRISPDYGFRGGIYVGSYWDVVYLMVFMGG